MNCSLVLSGKSGSGKDEFAHMIKDILAAHNKRTIIIHYADVLKYFLKEFYNWDGQKDAIGRSLLQGVGTDQVRAHNPDYWTHVVVDFLKAIEGYSDFDVAVIPDGRFENEINIALTTLDNCYSVRIERTNEDGTPWINPNLTEDQRKHPSETSLDVFAFDYVVHNDEGLELLKESAETLLKDLKLI